MLTKVFASNEPEQDRYQWTDSDYLKGLEILGNEAPSKAMFNALFRQEDEKINILSDKVDEIDTSTIEPELTQMSQQIANTQSDMDTLTNQYQTLEQQANTINQNISSLKSDVNANTQTLDGMRTAIDNANSANATNAQNLTTAENKADTAQATANTNANTITNALSSLNNLIQQAQQAIANASQANPSAVLKVQRNTAYNYGDVLIMDGLPSWAVVEYSYDDNQTTGLTTGAIAPSVSNITESGVKFTDGNVVWIVRHKNLLKHKGATMMLNAFGNNGRIASKSTLTVETIPEVGDTLSFMGETYTFVANSSSGYNEKNKTLNLVAGNINSTTDSIYSWLRSSANPYNRVFNFDCTNNAITIKENNDYKGNGYNPYINYVGGGSITLVNDTPSQLNSQIAFLGDGILRYNGVKCNDWALMNGNNGTVDATAKYFKIANTNEEVGKTYGNNYHIMTVDELPQHNHTYSGKTDSNAYGQTDHRHEVSIPITTGTNQMDHGSSSTSSALAAGGNNSSGSGYKNATTGSSSVGSHIHNYSGTTETAGKCAPINIEPAHVCVLACQQII